MEIRPVDPARLEREWPAIAMLLAPAVRQNPRQTLEGLRKRLESGAEHLLEVGGEATGVVVIEVTNERVCWTKYAAGVVSGGVRQKAKFMRQVVGAIEDAAREAGCTEHRICGRDWSRIFPEYSPLEGFPNGLTKEL